jgi:hypothetical protein
MKRFLWFVLLPVLLLSLWFNWRALHQSRAGAPAQNNAPLASPPNAPPGPVLTDTIDFTGTGFEDGAWKLDPDPPGALIPDQIPGTELPAAPAPPGEWDPDLQLSPEPRSKPE